MSTLDTRPGPAPRAGTRYGHGSRPRSPSRPTTLDLLVVANAVSMTGNVLITVAVPWLVLTTTGSAAIAGTVLATRSAGDTAALVGGFIALVVARSALLTGGEALAGQSARRSD